MTSSSSFVQPQENVMMKPAATIRGSPIAVVNNTPAAKNVFDKACGLATASS
jgi:hypothetical protein